MSTLPSNTPDSPAAMRDALLSRLNALGRIVRKHLALEGAAVCGAVTVGMLLLSLLLDQWLQLALPTRVVLLIAGILGLLYLAVTRIALPLWRHADPLDLTAAIDHRQEAGRTAITPRVATVLQLPDLSASDRSASPAFIERAVVRAYESLRSVDFTRFIDARRLRVSLAVIVVAIVVPLLFVAIARETATTWFERWILGSARAWPQDTFLHVAGVDESGRIIVAKGEPYVLRVSAEERSTVMPESITIRWQPEDGDTVSGAFTRYGENDFRYDFPPVTVPISARIRGGDARVGPIEIIPVERPRLVGVEITAKHPAEKEASLFAADQGELAFLPQTDIKLVLTGSVPIEQVRITPEDAVAGSPQRVSDTQFAISWKHEHAVRMSIELVEAQAGLPSRPVPLAVGLKLDREPRVNVKVTGVRSRITPSAKVPLIVLARDDYGIAQMTVNAQAESLVPPPVDDEAADEAAPDADAEPDGEAAPANEPPSMSAVIFGPADVVDQTQIEARHTIDVKAMELTPGMLLHVVGTAEDACYIGAQTGESRRDTFQIVDPNELLREIRIRLQTLRASFRQSTDDANDLHRLLTVLTQTEEAQFSLRRHRVTERNVVRLADQLADTVTEMDLNELGSPAANQLLVSGVQQPMRVLHDRLMADQRRLLADLGEKIDQDKLSQSVALQGEIVTAMRDILKRMEQWDSFLDVIAQLNEVIDLQEGVLDKTNKAKDKDADDLFDD